MTQSHTFNSSYFRKLPFDLTRDFAAITKTDIAPMVVVVHPSFPAKSMGDLVKLAQARPGKIDYASAGVGTSTYLAAELFKMAAGLHLVEVPYRSGAPSLIAVLAGEVPVYLGPIATVMPFVRQGKLRALAVSTSKRLPMLPEYQELDYYRRVIEAFDAAVARGSAATTVDGKLVDYAMVGMAKRVLAWAQGVPRPS